MVVLVTERSVTEVPPYGEGEFSFFAQKGQASIPGCLMSR